uniref:EF-hand domain-containing protein n=1 Tax=Trichogramma kaykai TaxID=54128 RepID=A0ABD2W9V1_9HYME
MNVYLPDMQGFRAESKFIIKELAIIPLYNGNIPKLYLFKAPHGFEKYWPKNNEINRWLERHYHRLKWNHGVVSYDKLGDILKKVLRNAYSEYVKVLKKAFDAFDHEKKGCIGTDMIGTILSMLGYELSESTLQEIISEVDEDGSGQLEFDEFCTLAARFLVEEDTEAMQQELREAFRLYDKEGNGYITTDVFRDILHELDDKLSPEELDLMIEEIDADGSGTLDFDEFMEVMTGGDE